MGVKLQWTKIIILIDYEVETVNHIVALLTQVGEKWNALISLYFYRPTKFPSQLSELKVRAVVDYNMTHLLPKHRGRERSTKLNDVDFIYIILWTRSYKTD